MRGQANLAALALAVVALTSVTALGVVVADGALADADRAPLDRRAAAATADRLVSADSPLTRRANVVDAGALERLTVARLVALSPPLSGRSFSVCVADRRCLSRGDPTGGVTVRRIVLVASATNRTRTASLSGGSAVTLPRRTDRATLALSNATGVRTVRANGRVVLHDPAGLTGTYRVRLSRYETTTLSFAGAAPAGTVTLTTRPERTTKATLTVTADD